MGRIKSISPPENDLQKSSRVIRFWYHIENKRLPTLILFSKIFRDAMVDKLNKKTFEMNNF